MIRIGQPKRHGPGRPLALGVARCAAVAALLVAAPAWTQSPEGPSLPEPAELVQVSAAPPRVEVGGSTTAVVHLRIRAGWHVNANPPATDYLIPTEVKLAGGAGLAVGPAQYPTPRRLKLAFDENPLQVYDGEAEVRLPLSARGAAVGAQTLKGSVRFQACNDQVCLAPADLPFELSVEVIGAGAATASDRDAASGESSTTPAPAGSSGVSRSAGSTFSSGPKGAGPSSAALDNPIARAFAASSVTAFVSLFLIGLALNLTPCVYPMLGVTVSIFGARRAAPPLQVFGLALLYVLGISVLYSTLGLVAALTGGLFGALLQNPVVLVGIGFLLVALSLSMFGLYEFQLPPELLAKLGGTGATSAAGIFALGLVVGIFAAPCTGPPVAALLLLVGAKGDPWFGFLSFFVLSLGLGAPYLVLGTFSNLLQKLPRSGDWMVWVKKVFGVILIAVGCFYVLLAAAPKWAIWVLPVALIAGGFYLGFLEKSGTSRRGFRRIKWATGTVATLAGVLFVAATPGSGIALRAFDPAQLEAGFAAGRPAMLDFSADWCLPCHELERATFSDPRVVDRARAFHVYKVDLTRYDSPESDRWRRQYGIRSVPTVIFLAPDGREVRGTRVEGFLPPELFLERMRLAEATASTAGQ